MAAYAEAIDGSRTCRQWMGTVWIQQAHQSHKSMSRMSFLSVDYWSWALEAKVMLLMRHVVNKIVASSTANKQRRGGRLQPEVARVKLRSQTAAGRWIICGSLLESCKSWRFRIIFFWLWFTMVQLIGFKCFPNYVSLEYESFLSILKKKKPTLEKNPDGCPGVLQVLPPSYQILRRRVRNSPWPLNENCVLFFVSFKFHLDRDGVICC